ncbi:hypothetical protein WMF30_41395 [Sorangium sp. So ce134]
MKMFCRVAIVASCVSASLALAFSALAQDQGFVVVTPHMFIFDHDLTDSDSWTWHYPQEIMFLKLNGEVVKRSYQECLDNEVQVRAECDFSMNVEKTLSVKCDLVLWEGSRCGEAVRATTTVTHRTPKGGQDKLRFEIFSPTQDYGIVDIDVAVAP